MGRVGWGGKGGMERMRLEGSDGIRWKGLDGVGGE